MTDRIESLYQNLTRAFPHPFDWMGGLHRQPIWSMKRRKGHRKIADIFARHGFTLTEQVADDYHRIFPDDWQHYGEDAGGKITRKLARALKVEAGL